ncbi:hypothetical protein, partial [Bradyrhizobium sp. BRP22]|uniref:hypothetical protein n=1 Tax=Bradyrhizobium sp. BRP22 TaxID=2793821 RepID=UPI001CD20FEF
SPLTSSQNADSITASAGAGCSRSSEFGAHDRAKSLLTISEICSNLCLQIVRPALSTCACVHLDTW